MGAFFGKKDWGRLLTAMVTPFDHNNQVNVEMIHKLAKYLVEEQKNDGLVVCGTTGESPTLTHDEKLLVLEETLNAVGDQVAIIMGTGTNNTADSITMTKEAEKRGAHGVMLVNPYYNKPGQAGLEAHFKAIASETSLPVMLYNIQPRSAINLETNTLMRLAEVPNIVAVKEASGNMNQVADVCAQMPEGFRVYSGDDPLTLPMMSVGAHGLVSVAAHIKGARIKAMMDAFLAGRNEEATRISQEVLPAVRAVFSAPSPSPVKYALNQKGIQVGEPRLPIVSLDAHHQKIVNSVL